MFQKQFKSLHRHPGSPASPNPQSSHFSGILYRLQMQPISICSRISSLLAWAILLFGISTAVVTAVIVFLTFNPIIQWDQWIVVNEMMRHNGQFSLGWLWAQHNEHRIPWGKVACYADLALFGGRNISLLCEIYVIRALESLFLIWIFRRFGGPKTAQVLTAAGFFIFCCFYPIQIENFDWGFQINFVLLPFCACVAIGTAILHADLISSREPRPWCSWVLLISLVSAFIAESSLASGIFVWPMVLLVSFVFQMPGRTKALIGAAGATAISAFFWNYHSPRHDANPLESLRHPIAVANYVRAYLGWSWDSAPPATVRPEVLKTVGVPSWLAVSSLWHALAQLCAILAVVVVLVAILRLLRMGAKAGKLEAFLVLNAAFLAITSVATALGRIILGLDQATSSRYQTIALAFWASFAGLMILWRAGRMGSVIRLLELQVVLILLLLSSVDRFAPSAALASARQRAMAEAYGEYIQNPSMSKAQV